MMNTVRDSAYALLTIINDILDFSKIEAGKLDLEEIPFSIRDTVEGVAETLGPNANGKGIRINIHVDPNIPDAVLAIRFEYARFCSIWRVMRLNLPNRAGLKFALV